MLANGLFDRRRKRSGVAYASRAAVTHQLKSQLLKIGQQTCLLQIFRHHARAGRERSLDVGWHGQSFLYRFFRQQSRCQHHARIGSIGAGSDGGNDHIAMPQRIRCMGDSIRRFGVATFCQRLLQQAFKSAFDLRQRDPVLGTARTGDAGLDGSEVKFHHAGVIARARRRDAE